MTCNNTAVQGNSLKSKSNNRDRDFPKISEGTFFHLIFAQMFNVSLTFANEFEKLPSLVSPFTNEP